MLHAFRRLTEEGALVHPQHVAGGENHTRGGEHRPPDVNLRRALQHQVCLLYTSDAADERSSVDLGGRRIIKKKNNTTHTQLRTLRQHHTTPAEAIT